MKIRIKNGDDYVEVDSEFSEDAIEIDRYLEDTMEIDTNKIIESVNNNE